MLAVSGGTIEMAGMLSIDDCFMNSPAGNYVKESTVE